MNSLEAAYGSSGHDLVVAGDFNNPRCANQDPPGERVAAPADDPSEGVLSDESVVCDLHTGDITGGGVTPAWAEMTSAGYHDTVFEANRTQPQLERQYRDGLHQRARRSRIDYIFAKGQLAYVRASYDLLCGVAKGDVLRPETQNCKWLRSPDRYSDHRLLWAIIGPMDSR
jgi:endonuclease/exonuclease/phosphatase family metal-dependent hydrolase